MVVEDAEVAVAVEFEEDCDCPADPCDVAAEELSWDILLLVSVSSARMRAICRCADCKSPSSFPASALFSSTIFRNLP